MYSLLATIALLILIFLIGAKQPFIAGLLAVIPIKIIGTALITSETGGRDSLQASVHGMLVGQFAWGFILLGTYLYIRYA